VRDKARDGRRHQRRRDRHRPDPFLIFLLEEPDAGDREQDARKAGSQLEPNGHEIPPRHAQKLAD
jgi:hypothetical protein